MLNLIRTDSQNPDFINLVKDLDAALAITDGDEHAFYDQFNKINVIKYVLLAYQNHKAIGCGAIKEFAPDIMEVKRMYVVPELRGKGVAGQILLEIETWAAKLGYAKCILETGSRQEAALALYHKSGYHVIENYGQYQGLANSVCFLKKLK